MRIANTLMVFCFTSQYWNFVRVCSPTVKFDIKVNSMSANSLGDIPNFYEGNIRILFKTDSESNSLAASYWITFPNKIRQDIFFILQEWFWKSFEMIFNSLEYPSMIPSVNSGTFNWSCSSQKCSIHNRPLKTGHLTHLAEKNGLKLWQMAFVKKNSD